MSRLLDIAHLQSGIFSRPHPEGGVLYLQGRHFNIDVLFDKTTRPNLKISQISDKHLLQNGDVLFAAKGLHNYAVVYNTEIGPAVASSSFFVVRLLDKVQILPQYIAWFLSLPSIINVLLRDVKLSTIPSVNMQQLAMLEINIPEVKKQELILRIDQLQKKEKDLNTQLTVLKNNCLRQKLLKATTE